MLKKILLAIAVLVAYLLLWPVPVEPVSWAAPLDKGFVGDFEENKKFYLSNQEFNWMSRNSEDKWIQYLLYRYNFKTLPLKKIVTDFPQYLLIEPASPTPAPSLSATSNTTSAILPDDPGAKVLFFLTSTLTILDLP